MRPAVFQVGGVVYWTLLTRNPDTGVLKDADSTPTVAVRKNGSSVADSVTVTKRSATTGIYDCSYNPAGEVEGDSFTLEESATVTGTTTSSATYVFGWSIRTVRTGAVELDPASRDAVADAVWDEAMSGHTTDGTYGARIVRATNSNVEVQVTGSNHIAADVHELQAGVITAGDFANSSLTAAALAADAIAEIQNGLSTLTAPQVNAEVVDALSVDTYAELTAPPAATSSLKDKLTWLFMYARNKVTQTATQRKLYRDDGTTVAGTSGTSDDGATLTKGEDA